MTIDEKRENVLTKYLSKKGEKKLVESDHNILSCEFNFSVKRTREIRKEVYNIRNEDDLEVFKNITESETEFTKCFENNLGIKEQGKRWARILKNKMKTAFKKIRVKKRAIKTKVIKR